MPELPPRPEGPSLEEWSCDRGLLGLDISLAPIRHLGGLIDLNGGFQVKNSSCEAGRPLCRRQDQLAQPRKRIAADTDGPAGDCSACRAVQLYLGQAKEVHARSGGPTRRVLVHHILQTA